MLKNKKGQSSVEYILLFAAVIAIMIFLLANDGVGLRDQINKTYTNATGEIGVMGDRLGSSR